MFKQKQVELNQKEKEKLIAMANEKANGEYANGAEILRKRRIKNNKFYYGLAADELRKPKGESGYVHNVVHPTVNNIVAQVAKATMEKGEMPVTFTPMGNDDVEAADQATQLTSYVINVMNDSYFLNTRALKSAGINGDAFVKVCPTNQPKSMTHPIDQMPMQKFQQMVHMLRARGREVMIDNMREDVMVEQFTDEAGQPMSQEIPVVSCELTIKTTGWRIDHTLVKPEDVGAPLDADDIQSADWFFCMHRMGIRRFTEIFPDADIDAILKKRGGGTGPEGGSSRGIKNTEENARLVKTGGYTNYADKATLIEVAEFYMTCKLSDDKPYRRYKFCFTGKEMLSVELCNFIPFAKGDLDFISHSFYSLSIAEMQIPAQLIQTNLMRSSLGKAWRQNRDLAFIKLGAFDLEDLQTGNSGFIKTMPNTNIKESFEPYPTTGNAMQFEGLMQYLETNRVSQVGVSNMSDQVNHELIKNNTSATAAQVFNTNNQVQVESYSREWTQTMWKQLAWITYQVLLQNGHRPEVKQMVKSVTGSDVFIDHERMNVDEFYTRDDITVSVGIGTKSLNEQVEDQTFALTLQANLNVEIMGLIQQGLPPTMVMKRIQAYRNLLKVKIKDVDTYLPSDEELGTLMENAMKSAQAQAAAAEDQSALQTAVITTELKEKKSKTELNEANAMKSRANATESLADAEKAEAEAEAARRPDTPAETIV